ncbi:MAG TPA: DUF3795 domain-containing protein [Ignavibacteriaceae bacterium]|nr:DUF3795 domain-containing protein [Ignavibacteriaceae bacterium]
MLNERKYIKLVAPCGINCGLCIAYFREKNFCGGCLSNNVKSISCVNCFIKNCTKKKNTYCYSCSSYPCQRLKHLDKRYKLKYGLSVIENLNYIKENGLRKFVEKEKFYWECKECGSPLCMHRDECINCGELRDKRKYF